MTRVVQWREIQCNITVRPQVTTQIHGDPHAMFQDLQTNLVKNYGLRINRASSWIFQDRIVIQVHTHH